MSAFQIASKQLDSSTHQVLETTLLHNCMQACQLTCIWIWACFCASVASSLQPARRLCNRSEDSLTWTPTRHQELQTTAQLHCTIQYMQSFLTLFWCFKVVLVLERSLKTDMHMKAHIEQNLMHCFQIF